MTRTDFNSLDAFGKMVETRGDEEDALQTFSDVLHWMKNEGLIHVSKILEYDGGYNFNGVQLSANGIAAIKAQPGGIGIQETIQETIDKSGGEPLDNSMYTRIGEFFGSFAGGFTKSLGSG